jgi:hypothetical protein
VSAVVEIIMRDSSSGYNDGEATIGANNCGKRLTGSRGDTIVRIKANLPRKQRSTLGMSWLPKIVAG